MPEIELPKNWLKIATPVPEPEAKRWKQYRPEGGIMFDDDCPLQISIIVIIKNNTEEPQVFRITNPVIVSSALKRSEYPEEIKKIYQLEDLRPIAGAPCQN